MRVTAGSAPSLTGGSPNDRIRRNNLRTLLSILHHGGVHSRAELTRLTGLNRSTIGALVGELTALGLAYETEPSETGTVGRPSPLVHANENVVALAVNPDVDAIIIGVVGLGGVVHKRVRFQTSGVPTVQETINIVSAIVEGMRGELDEKYHVVGVGLAVPGLVTAEEGVIALAPHLEWRDEPLAAPIAAALGYPALAANDANLGTVAERLWGIGRGVQNMVYLNGSTSGIGGGVIVDGHALSGARGFAAELGHTSVHVGGRACFCGRTGCLETEVSLVRLLAVLGRESIDADELEQIIASSDDPEVHDEIERQLDRLALGISNLISVFDPELVVLGGFLGTMFSADPERLRQRVARASFTRLAEGVRIERAELRSRQLLIGAAELAFGPLLDDPAAVAATAIAPRASAV
ncbi:ROK family protein [Humibacter sp. BT305]|nr:ROK family protein [Humibacter sp. BT305]